MLSFKLMIIFSAFFVISCGKEFILVSGVSGGSSYTDTAFMEALCEAEGNGVEPASIESAEENAQASTLCETGSYNCYIGLVREDSTMTDWYWRDGATYDADSYTNWGTNEGLAQDENYQGATGEQCVMFNVATGGLWHDVECSRSLNLICQQISGCSAVDIDGFLVGCSDEFAITNGNVADNEVRISNNTAAILTNTDLISDTDAAIQANTDLINSKSTAIEAEFQSVDDRFATIATFQGAHAEPAVVDGFVNNTSFFNLQNSFLLMSLLTNVFLVLSSCYMVNKARKGGYNKVKMYDGPNKH